MLSVATAEDVSGWAIYYQKSGNGRPVYAKIRVLDNTVARGGGTAMRSVKSISFLLAAAILAGFPGTGNTAEFESISEDQAKLMFYAPGLEDAVTRFRTLSGQCQVIWGEWI